MAEQTYTPGVCNINSQEVAKRRRAGYFDLGLFILFAVTLVATDASWQMRLLLLIPAFIASLAFLQARQKFCVAYAGAGKQNAAEGSTKPEVVVDASARKKDALKARKIYLQAFAISAVVTIITLFI
jgi:hypothetical protein